MKTIEKERKINMARTFYECAVNVLKGKRHYLTSGFGVRGSGYHYGCDLVGGTDKAATTDYIIALEGGTVTKATNDVEGTTPSEGNAVVINHGNGISSYYYHLKKGSVKVKKGDTVSRGDVLGYMGNTGNSTGAHLHLGIKADGKWVDPLPYLTGENELGFKRIGINMRTLSYTHRGGDVKTMQSLLNSYDGAGLTADGIFGKKTLSALKAYQQKRGLDADGVCGRQTWASLLGGEAQ